MSPEPIIVHRDLAGEGLVSLHQGKRAILVPVADLPALIADLQAEAER